MSTSLLTSMSQGADIYPDSLQLPWHTVQRPDASARRLPWRDRSSSSNLRSGARPASTGHDRHHNERPVSAWTRNVHRTEWMLLDIRLIAFSPLECMAPDVIVLTHIAFDELSNRNIASTRSQTSRYNRSQTVLVDHFEEGGAQRGPVSQVNAHGSSRSQKRNDRRSLPDSPPTCHTTPGSTCTDRTRTERWGVERATREIVEKRRVLPLSGHDRILRESAKIAPL